MQVCCAGGQSGQKSFSWGSGKAGPGWWWVTGWHGTSGLARTRKDAPSRGPLHQVPHPTTSPSTPLLVASMSRIERFNTKHINPKPSAPGTFQLSPPPQQAPTNTLTRAHTHPHTCSSSVSIAMACVLGQPRLRPAVPSPRLSPERAQTLFLGKGRIRCLDRSG